MGKHTRPAREGKCKHTARLISGTYLYCDREETHEGTHRDDTEGMWWLPSARLEVINLPCLKRNPRTGWICGLDLGHTGEYENGRHLTVIEGERYDWQEES